MRVKSIMSRPVVTVRSKNSVKEAVKKMAQKGISCVVIIEKKAPIGIFNKRDLLGLLASDIDLSKVTMESVMHTPVIPVPENEKIFAASRRMRRMDVRRMIIVDKSGKLNGIITDTDIVRSFASHVLSYRESLAALATVGLTATPKTSLKKISSMMINGRKSCITIIKNSKPVGIITEQLFVKLAARHKDPLNFVAEDKMIKKFISANMETSVRAYAMEMIKKKLRHIVCVDNKKRYKGLISQRELVSFVEESHL